MIPFASRIFGLLKSKDASAIDIGSSSIKLLHLKKNNGRYFVDRKNSIFTGDANPEASPQDRRVAITGLMRDLFQHERLKKSNVVSSVSGNQIVVRSVRLPWVSPEELAKNIRFEAEPYIPFDLKDVEICYHTTGEVSENNQRKIEVILVAVKREAIIWRLDILNDLGLRAVLFDLDAFALANSYIQNARPDVAESVAVLNIGASVANLVIMEGQVPRVIRDFFIAGTACTKAIQRAAGNDFAAAEKLKLDHGLSLFGETKDVQLADANRESLMVFQALTPVMKDIAAELRRSIDFFISQNPERSVSRILLCGGSSLLKGIDRYLAKDLGIPAALFNPLAFTDTGDHFPPEEFVKYAVAAGLALRFENDARAN